MSRWEQTQEVTELLLSIELNSEWSEPSVPDGFPSCRDNLDSIK